MKRVRPVIVLDCPTAEEVLDEWNGSEIARPRPDAGGAPKLPPRLAKTDVVIKALAKEIGRDARHAIERAKKLGCVVEYKYARDSRGAMQRAAVTNPAGAYVLRCWYGDNERKTGEVDNLDEAIKNGWVWTGQTGSE